MGVRMIRKKLRLLLTVTAVFFVMGIVNSVVAAKESQRRILRIWNDKTSVATEVNDSGVTGFKIYASGKGKMEREIATVKLISQDKWVAKKATRYEKNGVTWIELRDIETRGTGYTPQFGSDSYIKIGLNRKSPYPKVDFSLDIKSFSKLKWENSWKEKVPLYFLECIMNKAQMFYLGGFLYPSPKVDPFPISRPRMRGNWGKDWSYAPAMGATPLPAVGLWAPKSGKFVAYEFQDARNTDKSSKYIASSYFAGTKAHPQQFFALLYPYQRHWTELTYPEQPELVKTHFTIVYDLNIYSYDDPNMFMTNYIWNKYKDFLPGAPRMNDLSYLPPLDSVQMLLYFGGPANLLQRGGWHLKNDAETAASWFAREGTAHAYMTDDTQTINRLKNQINYLISKAQKETINGDECIYWKYPLSGSWQDKSGGEKATTARHIQTWDIGVTMLEIYKHDKDLSLLPYIDGILRWTEHYLYTRGAITDLPWAQFAAFDAADGGQFLLDYYHTFKNDTERKQMAKEALRLARVLVYKGLHPYTNDPDETDRFNPTFLFQAVNDNWFYGKVTFQEMGLMLKTMIVVYTETGDPILKYYIRGALEKWGRGYIKDSDNLFGFLFNTAENIEVFGEMSSKYSRPGGRTPYNVWFATAFRRYAEPIKGTTMRVVVGKKAAIAFDWGTTGVDITDYTYGLGDNFSFKLLSSIDKQINIVVSAPYRDLRGKKVYVNNNLLSQDRYTYNNATEGEDVYIRGIKNGDVIHIGQSIKGKVVQLEDFHPRQSHSEKYFDVLGFRSINLEPYCNDRLDKKWDWDNADSWAGLIPGEHFYKGIPFFIVDPEVNGGKDVISAKQDTVRIPIGLKAKAIYLFGRISDYNKDSYLKGEEVGKWKIIYKDGEEKEIPIVRGPTVLSGYPVKNWSMDLFPFSCKSNNYNKVIKAIEIYKEPLVFAVTIGSEQSKRINKISRILKSDYRSEILQRKRESKARQVIEGNKIALIPPQINTIEMIRRVCKLLGLSLKVLTPGEYVNPKVFNPDNYPVAIYAGGEYYIKSYHKTDDGEKALTSYLKNGGFLLSFGPGGTWPLLYPREWNSKTRRWKDTIILPSQSNCLSRFNAKLGLFIAGTGIKIGSITGFETPPPGKLTFVFNPEQTVIPSFPSQIPYPKAGDLRWRPVTGFGLPPEDKYVPILTLKDEKGKSWGQGIAYIEHNGSKYKGAKVIYVWGTLLDTKWGKTIMSDIIAFAVQHSKIEVK